MAVALVMIEIDVGAGVNMGTKSWLRPAAYFFLAVSHDFATQFVVLEGWVRGSGADVWETGAEKWGQRIADGPAECSCEGSSRGEGHPVACVYQCRASVVWLVMVRESTLCVERAACNAVAHLS